MVGDARSRLGQQRSVGKRLCTIVSNDQGEKLPHPIGAADIRRADIRHMLREALKDPS